jgi:hypothetical protein
MGLGKATTVTSTFVYFVVNYSALDYSVNFVVNYSDEKLP